MLRLPEFLMTRRPEFLMLRRPEFLMMRRHAAPLHSDYLHTPPQKSGSNGTYITTPELHCEVHNEIHKPVCKLYALI